MLASGLVLCTSVSQTGQLNDVSKYLTIQLLQTKKGKANSYLLQKHLFLQIQSIF